jgi:hypothetical protein
VSKDRLFRIRGKDKKNELNSNKTAHKISGPMIRSTDTMIGISKLKNGLLLVVIMN